MMAVDPQGRGEMDDGMAVKEAAAAWLRSLEHLAFQRTAADCRGIADLTVSKHKEIPVRTGHARFRRGPAAAAPAVGVHEGFSGILAVAMAEAQTTTPPPMVAPQTLTLNISKSTADIADTALAVNTNTSATSSSTNSCFLSPVTGDGSVSNGKIGPIILAAALSAAATAALSSGRSPFASSLKKICLGEGHGHAHTESLPGKHAGGCCHCSKKKKPRVKKTIRPSISSRNSDILANDYSRRKYGRSRTRAPLTPTRRDFYKCSSVRG